LYTALSEMAEFVLNIQFATVRSLKLQIAPRY